jgi:cytochrome P450 monooxygenase
MEQPASLSTGERSVPLLVWTVLVVALTFLYRTWRRHRDTQTFKRQHGCKDPPQYPHQDRIWGSDLARIRADAMKQGRLFPQYLSQFERYGKTFEENWRGKRLINTMEPANIQQISAFAFDDYCKDPERLKAQAPFIGPSIFSDGPIWKPSRALVNPIFHRAELSDIDQLASFADRFMELIPGDGSTIDMQPLLHRLVRSYPSDNET